MKIEHSLKKDASIIKAYSFLNKLNGIILFEKIKVKSIDKRWSGDDFRFILNLKKGKILEFHLDGIINFYDNQIELNFSFPPALRDDEEKIKEVLTSKIKEALLS